MTINSGSGSPIGITIDPANISNLWLVGGNTDSVDQIDAAANHAAGPHPVYQLRTCLRIILCSITQPAE